MSYQLKKVSRLSPTEFALNNELSKQSSLRKSDSIPSLTSSSESLDSVDRCQGMVEKLSLSSKTKTEGWGQMVALEAQQQSRARQ
jgi:hypothetical protein